MSLAGEMFSVRAGLTGFVAFAYVGGCVWALVQGQMDIQSFIAGLGPSLGVLVKSWTDEADVRAR